MIQIEVNQGKPTLKDELNYDFYFLAKYSFQRDFYVFKYRNNKS